MKLAAFILNLLSTISSFLTAVIYSFIIGVSYSTVEQTIGGTVFVITCIVLCFISMAWMIPMTVRSYNIYKNNEVPSIAFGVCDLLFVNLIAGILLLVSTGDTSSYNYNNRPNNYNRTYYNPSNSNNGDSNNSNSNTNDDKVYDNNDKKDSNNYGTF